MLSRNPGSNAQRIAKSTISAIAVLGLLALAGCSSSATEPSSSTEPPMPPGSEVATTELHIYLDQCKQLEAGLYKCPAFEKDICDPVYKGEAQCVRTGRKGSIFVQSNSTN